MLTMWQHDASARLASGLRRHIPGVTSPYMDAAQIERQLQAPGISACRHLSACSLSESSRCASTPSTLKFSQASSSRQVPLTCLRPGANHQEMAASLLYTPRSALQGRCKHCSSANARTSPAASAPLPGQLQHTPACALPGMLTFGSRA